jgi:hypothetical protein
MGASVRKNDFSESKSAPYINQHSAVFAAAFEVVMFSVYGAKAE